MFIESFRPGMLEKMGSARTLLERNPEARDRAHLRLGPGRAQASVPASAR